MAQTDMIEEIPRLWVLLDNQSMVHLFNSCELLYDVHRSNKSMKIASYGGTSITNMEGGNTLDLVEYGMTQRPSPTSSCSSRIKKDTKLDMTVSMAMCLLSTWA